MLYGLTDIGVVIFHVNSMLHEHAISGSMPSLIALHNVAKIDIAIFSGLLFAQF